MGGELDGRAVGQRNLRNYYWNDTPGMAILLGFTADRSVNVPPPRL